MAVAISGCSALAFAVGVTAVTGHTGMTVFGGIDELRAGIARRSSPLVATVASAAGVRVTSDRCGVIVTVLGTGASQVAVRVRIIGSRTSTAIATALVVASANGTTWATPLVAAGASASARNTRDGSGMAITIEVLGTEPVASRVRDVTRGASIAVIAGELLLASLAVASAPLIPASAIASRVGVATHRGRMAATVQGHRAGEVTGGVGTLVPIAAGGAVLLTIVLPRATITVDIVPLVFTRTLAVGNGSTHCSGTAVAIQRVGTDTDTVGVSACVTSSTRSAIVTAIETAGAAVAGGSSPLVLANATAAGVAVSGDSK